MSSRPPTAKIIVGKGDPASGRSGAGVGVLGGTAAQIQSLSVGQVGLAQRLLIQDKPEVQLLLEVQVLQQPTIGEGIGVGV